MSMLRALLVSLLVAFGLVALTPAVAQACSCAVVPPAQQAAGADVVFTGTLTDVVPPPRRPVMSSGDPATLRFHVTGVGKGRAAETTEVTTAVSGASCGLGDLAVHREYVVYAHGSDTLSAGLCDGTGPATPAAVRRAERVVGPFVAPVVAPTADTRSAPDDGSGPIGWLAVGAAALVATAVGVLALRRAR